MATVSLLVLIPVFEQGEGRVWECLREWGIIGRRGVCGVSGIFEEVLERFGKWDGKVVGGGE